MKTLAEKREEVENIEKTKKKSISNNNDSDKIIEVRAKTRRVLHRGLSSYPSVFQLHAYALIQLKDEMGELLYPSFCFIYPFVQQQARGMRMMKNLQNYAKNVQLVKRNIILCVASFYIASFPFLN